MIKDQTKIEKLISELCPHGVSYKELGKVAKYSKYRIDASALDHESYVGVDNLLQNKQGKTASNYVPKSGKLTQFNPGDILIGNIRPYLKKIWLSDCVGGTNGDVLAVEINDKQSLSPEFLYFLLSSDDFFNFDMKFSKGAKMPRGNKDAILKYKIPVPPLAIQDEIVKILNKFTELEAELEARQKQYEYYLEKEVNNNSWPETVLLDMLAQPITDGPHETPSFVDQGIPFISAEAVYEGKVHLTSKRGFITKEYDDICAKKYKPQKEDVYMVKSGSTTGKVAIVDIDDDFNIWSPIAAMRANKLNNPRFLYHLLKSKTVQDQVKKNMSKGSQPNLGMRALEKFVVHAPSLEKQNNIAHLLDKFDALVTDISIGLPAELNARRQQYEYYRNKLLTFNEYVG